MFRTRHTCIPSDGGSEFVTWNSYWWEIDAITEYPGAYIDYHQGVDAFYNIIDSVSRICVPDAGKAIKHPVIWDGDTIHGECQVEAGKHPYQMNNPNRCTKTMRVDIQPNTSEESRGLVILPYGSFVVPYEMVQEGRTEGID